MRYYLHVLAALALVSGDDIEPRIFEDDGPADLDIWFGECPFNADAGCNGVTQLVRDGVVMDNLNASDMILIASGMNTMFIRTSTYIRETGTDGQLDFEAINLRYFTESSEPNLMCDQAAIFLHKKADGLVYAPVTEAVDTDEPFGLSFIKDGQRGNKLFLKPYALGRTEQPPNGSLPTLKVTILPTVVHKKVSKRACTAAEIDELQTKCYTRSLEKRRKDKIVLRFPARTEPSSGPHRETVDACWKAYAIDQGDLVPKAERNGSEVPPALWLLLSCLIVASIAFVLARR